MLCLSSSVLDDHYLNSFNAQSVLPDLWISLVHEKLRKEISGGLQSCPQSKLEQEQNLLFG